MQKKLNGNQLNRGSRIAIALLACGLDLLVTSCASRTESAEAPRLNSGKPEAAIVPVVKVVRSTLSSDLVLTGEFIPYQEIDVMAKEAGYIKAIHVDIGDRMHTGQRIAELDIPEMQNDIVRAEAGTQASLADIATARGNLTRAQSTSDIADLSYKRILDVSTKEPGLVPRQEVDVAHARQLEAAALVASAQANLSTAQQKLAMAKADQARWATLEKYTIIAAPFDGVVTKRYANTGAMIQQGTSSSSQAMPVIRLSQNNLLRLLLPVPESAAPSIRVGETVDVTVDALHKTFPGRVTRFEDKVDMSTRTMNTEVDVPNRDYVLIPGMYAQVKLHMSQSKKVLAVPLDAVEETDGGREVYAVQGDTVRVLPVSVGVKTSQQQEIRTGVQEGDLVIVGRHAGLENGQKVQPKLVHFDDAAVPAQGS
ncbi:MAG TPA: efflux RND transporter periplasmic adaptor subunit [Bryobacteraceae bacterium]|nr:efflux RND transporter periplasmic adaptor subunit [Bryobacteraceae bacterium]